MAKFLSIRINPDNFNRRFRIEKSQVDDLGRTFYDNSIREFLAILKDNTPERTGKLASSWHINSKRNKGGGLSFAASAYVESDVHYGQYVDRGAKSSPGAFVPGKTRGKGYRRKGGTHPGQPGQNFVHRSIREMETRYSGYRNEAIGRFQRRFVRRLHGQFK